MHGQLEVPSLTYIAEFISLISGIRASLGKNNLCFGKYFDNLLKVENKTQRACSVWKWQIATLAAYDMLGNLEKRGEQGEGEGKLVGRRLKLGKTTVGGVTKHFLRREVSDIQM